MSVYNIERPEYLAESLQSLVEQSLRANEIILVEDGQISNELQEVIEKFRNTLCIRTIKLNTNVGLASALNVGLSHCLYDLVARMDTDDIALPERFKKQVDVLNNNSDVDVVGAFAYEIDGEGIRGRLRKMPVSHEAIFDNLFTCPFIHPSVVFRKDKVIGLAGYNESLVRRQDYDLWFRFAKAGMGFYNIPEPLLLYRFTAATHSRQSMRLMFSQAIIGYKGVRSLEQSYVKALYCFIPLFRSCLPKAVRHYVYKWMKKYDPRELQ